jgi:hypothetical protein
MADTYNSKRLIRIKEEKINIIKGKIYLDVEAFITNMIFNLNKERLASRKPTIQHKEVVKYTEGKNQHRN